MPKKINVVNLQKIEEEQQPTDIVVDFPNHSQIDERSKIEAEVKSEENKTEPIEDKPKTKTKTKAAIETYENNTEKPKRNKKKQEITENVNNDNVENNSVENIVENNNDDSKVENNNNANEKVKKIRTQELVKCEKCDKEMTQRTLRYCHDKVCPGKVIVREEIPVKKRTTNNKKMLK